MEDIRRQINEADEQIVKLLAKRMELVIEISSLKQASGIEPEDKKREEEIRDRLKSIAKQKGLNEEFVNHLYTHIFIESHRIQEQSE